jgi:hypothetical protein
MRVVNHSINHASHVLRNGHDQPPGWQLLGPQMNLASRADMHGWRPHPAQRFHQFPERSAVHSRSRIALSAFPRPRSFLHRELVHVVVHSLVRDPGGDGHRAHHAVSGRTCEPRQPSPAIIELKFHPLGGSLIKIEEQCSSPLAGFLFHLRDPSYVINERQ